MIFLVNVKSSTIGTLVEKRKTLNAQINRIVYPLGRYYDVRGFSFKKHTNRFYSYVEKLCCYGFFNDM